LAPGGYGDDTTVTGDPTRIWHDAVAGTPGTEAVAAVAGTDYVQPLKALMTPRLLVILLGYGTMLLREPRALRLLLPLLALIMYLPLKALMTPRLLVILLGYGTMLLREPRALRLLLPLLALIMYLQLLALIM
jgi:hypothetical protein